METPFNGYVAGCEICEKAAAAGTRPFVRHDNCNSPGSAGHGRNGHCTSDFCY